MAVPGSGRALSAAAALPLLLLCALPLLCVAHCTLSKDEHGAAHAAHHGAAAHEGHSGHGTAGLGGEPKAALCDHLAGAGDGLFIPAYWPGLPVAAATPLAGLALLMRLAAGAPSLPLSPAFAPQAPPPR